MKLGVFMLWTEMRTPQSGLLPGSAQHAEALSAVGLGQPFAHDDVIPEALQLGTLRSVPQVAPPAPAEPSQASPARASSKLAGSRQLVGAEKLAKVVSTVRAKRAASQPQAVAARPRTRSPQVTGSRSSAKQLAAR